MAFTSQLTNEDVNFIRLFLSKNEQILFFRMNIIDQKHGLSVAKSFINQKIDYPWLDNDQFVKIALLHDLGKSIVKIPLYVRILFVILNHFQRFNLLNKFAKENGHFLTSQYLYVLKYHGEIGAKMLEDIGAEKELILITKLHHHLPNPNESPLLPILRELDNHI